MSINNVIFDFGQVLVHFEPSYMVGVYVSDENDKALLEEVVFDRLYWDRLDKGTISNEETVSLIKERLPERLWDVSEKIYYN
jgi:putative hydrolase of the HAD superfamily